jgi:hypothetical protein
MKRILTLMILTATLLGAQTPTASRWAHFFVAADGDGSNGYYDTETVQYRASDNQYVTAWVKVVEKDGGWMSMHFELHATTRRARNLSWARYDASGQLLTSSKQQSSAWDDIIPESLADLLLHRLYRFDKPAPPAVRY